MRHIDGNHRWGIELAGPERSKAIWTTLLSKPFDPFVVQVEHEFGPYLALISSSFDDLEASSDVNHVAGEVLSTLNTLMKRDMAAAPIQRGAVVEFVKKGNPRKHYFIKAEAGSVLVTGGIAGLAYMDAALAAEKQELRPSLIQRKMQIIRGDERITSAMLYLQGDAGWTELYKACEALKSFPIPQTIKSEIGRLRQTANAIGRHHPSPKFPPPDNPMELAHARLIIDQWVSGLIEDALLKIENN